jgi:hypothetical protein
MVGMGEESGDGALGGFIAPKQWVMGKEVCMWGGGSGGGSKARQSGEGVGSGTR